MRSVQSKFEALIETAAKEAGLEAVVEHNWANTGVIRIQKPDSFTTLVRVEFDFQSNYCSLTVVPAIAYGRQETLASHVYLNGKFDDLTIVISQVIELALRRAL